MADVPEMPTRDWSKMASDVSLQIERLGKYWDENAEKLTEEEYAAFVKKNFPMISLLAQFCVMVTTVLPFDDPGVISNPSNMN